MIPEYYFKVICCPNCKSDLEEIKGKDELFCQCCNASYPVIQNIPILLHGVEDETSQIIKQFYDSEWKKNRDGVLKAKVKHEDLSRIGQLYIKKNENRFSSLFDNNNDITFFLDAASGAQPRVDFGKNFDYHICVDFSLDGMVESRKILGNRAICICGSLLNMPIKDLTCNGIIASHVLYHIDKDLQEDAVSQLYRVMRPEGKLLIFYGNPHSFERVIIKSLKMLIRRNTIKKKSSTQTIYYHAHTISHMLNLINNIFGNSSGSVISLRLFSIAITQKLFNNTIFGSIFYNAIIFVENIFRKIPTFSSYIAYIAKK